MSSMRLGISNSDERPGIARTIAGLDVGVTICEDAWQHCGATPNDYDSDPIAQIVEWGRQGVVLDATVNLSASPYHANKSSTRIAVARSAASSLNHPFLLANQVGGNDDLLFDGRSIIAWPDGTAVVGPLGQKASLSLIYPILRHVLGSVRANLQSWAQMKIWKRMMTIYSMQ